MPHRAYRGRSTGAPRQRTTTDPRPEVDRASTAETAAREYARPVMLRIGVSREEWRAEHGPPLVLEGTLAVWTDGSVTIDVGDGVLRPLGDVVADYFESRPDVMGDRFVGRVELRVDLLATPPPPGWVEGD